MERACAAIIAALWTVPVTAHAEARYPLAIKAQALEGALYDLAAQANVSLSLPNAGLGGLASPGLNGKFTPEQALEQLLRDSGFSYRRAARDSFVIFVADVSGIKPDASDVVVIAARRPTAQGDLPRDVSRIDGTSLSAAGLRDPSALVSQTSGLAFTNLGEGRDKLIMRGVSDGALTGRAQSSVGIYLDDARITYAAPDPDLQLVDIAAIEILRGPQGALYGAGSIGGVMRIETRPVDLAAYGGSAYAAVESAHDGGLGSDVEIVVNAPLVANRVGVRGVYYNELNAGWVDNPGLGLKNANKTRRRGWRMRGAVTGRGDWRFEPFIASQRIDSADAQYVDQASDLYQRTAHMREPHDNDFTAYGATLKGRLTWADISSTTAMVRHELTSRYDATGGMSAFGVSAASVTPLDERDRLSMLVHETRLSAPAGAALPWFIGFFHADGDNARTVTVREGAYNVWAQTDYSEQRTDAIDENALFGEVKWKLASALTLSTGMRLFSFRVRTRSDVSQPLIPATASFAGALNDVGAAPDIRLAFEPRRGRLFYLAAAEGYRAGGFNTGGPAIASFSGPQQPLRQYGGDELWTYEAGTRLALAHNRIDLQSVVFLNDWRNLQTDDLKANGLTYTGNVGRAFAYGIEGELGYEIDDHLAVRVHGSIDEPDLTHVAGSFPSTVDSNLPGAPEYAAGASFAYTRPLVLYGAGARVSAELDANYVGKARLDFKDPVTVGDYAVINARLGLRLRDWEGAIYVRNLAGSDGLTFSEGDPYRPGNPAVTPPPPRSLGLSLRRSF